MIDRYTVANALYTAYCAAVGGLAFNGDKLPIWEVFSTDLSKKKQSDAWLAAADRAIELLMDYHPEELEEEWESNAQEHAPSPTSSAEPGGES